MIKCKTKKKTHNDTGTVKFRILPFLIFSFFFVLLLTTCLLGDDIDSLRKRAMRNWGPWEVTQEPTCEAPGMETRTCQDDPSYTETQYLDSLGHEFLNYVSKLCINCLFLETCF